MNAQYATYTKFQTPEDAQSLIVLLQQHEIPYSLEHEVNQLDKIYIGETIDPMFALKIPGNRFNDTHALLAGQAKADMTKPDFEHYLQSYSTEELQEILETPDGWNAYDIQVATALLVEKTAGQSPVIINDGISYVPAKLEKKWIVLGYLACLFALTDFFYFAAAGFFAGLAITQAKRTLKNGDTVKIYSKDDLKHGRNMMFLSVLSLLAGAFLLYYRIRFV